MNKFNKAVLFGFVFASAVALCGKAFSQTTTTIGGLTMTNYVPLTPTGSYFHANLSGSDRRILSVDVAKMVLNNLTLSNGGSTVINLTGILTTTSGTLGVLTLTQTTTGNLTLSNMLLSSATGATSLTLSAMQIITTSTAGVYTGLLSSTGGIMVGRHSGGGSFLSHTGSPTTTNIPVGISFGASAGDGTIQIRAASSRSIDFAIDATGYIANINSNGFQLYSTGGSNLAGIYSATSGILRATAAGTNAIGSLQTGGFGMGFRSSSTSGAMTVTDGIITLSNSTATGTISMTLADATTLTGRMVIVKNIGSIGGTITGTPATATLDGNTSLSIPASSSLRLISTGTVWISY